MVKDIIIGVLIVHAVTLSFITFRSIKAMKKIQMEVKQHKESVDAKKIGEAVKKEAMKHIYCLGYDRVNIFR